MTNVLDYGYVRLVETWGSDEQVIRSARMSSGKGFEGWGPVCPHCSSKNLEPAVHPDPNVLRCVGGISGADGDTVIPGCGIVKPKHGDEKLLAFLWRKRHTSPFEQCGMSIEVQAPVFVFREWMRHRTQSYNEFSARYAQMPNTHYVPSLARIKLTSDANKQAQGVAPLADDAALTDWLNELRRIQDVIYEHYERGLRLGVPKEVARLNTPVSRYSRMCASANLLNWLRFLGLRAHKDAQWEIQQFANVVGNLVAENFPRTWALFNERSI